MQAALAAVLDVVDPDADLDLAVVGGLALGVISGVVAQIPAVSFVRNFIPFVFIVILLLWSQRKEVWDAAR